MSRVNAFSKPPPEPPAAIPFPRAGARVLHLDMDSFFATVEQQARPELRGKPVGISIAPSAGGTIIGSSIEAKARGVGTATRIMDAQALIPDIAILPPNPGRYRIVHKRVRELMSQYTPDVQARSIDEIAIWLSADQLREQNALTIAHEIQSRIREEVGDWLSSSIGIGPNWWLAKTACGMRKPGGLLEITRENTRDLLGELKLTDLCGIAKRMAARFQLAGVKTPVEMYDTPPWELKRRFGIIGYYWWLRLHGYHVDTEDRPTRTIGHSSVVPKPARMPKELKPLLGKLCERTGRRMRKGGWEARVISVFISYKDAPGGWGNQVMVHPFRDSVALFKHAWGMLGRVRFRGTARLVAVRVSHLNPVTPEQLTLWPIGEQQRRVTAAADSVNDRWGEFTLFPAAIMGTENIAKDSIAFGQDMKHPDEPIQPRGV